MEVPRWAAPCRTSPAERTQALGWFLQLMLILLSCACWGCHLHRLPHPAHRNGLGPQNSGKSRDKAGDSSTAALSSQGNLPQSHYRLCWGKVTDWQCESNVTPRRGQSCPTGGWGEQPSLPGEGSCTPADRRSLLAAPRHPRQVAHVHVDGHQFLVTTHHRLRGLGLMSHPYWSYLMGTDYRQNTAGHCLREVTILNNKLVSSKTLCWLWGPLSSIYSRLSILIQGQNFKRGFPIKCIPFSFYTWWTIWHLEVIILKTIQIFS